MEISSSLILHLSPSLHRPSPASLPFSVSHSSFVVSTPSLRLSNRVRATSVVCNRSRRQRFSVNALFGLGVPELVVIAGVAALVFGPKQLPEIGKSIGKTVKSFQQAAKEFESELKKEPDSPTVEVEAKAVNDEKKEDGVSSTKENV